MSDKPSLSERLRDNGGRHINGLYDNEAADEIDRLTTENADLRKLLAAVDELAGGYLVERDKARAELAALRAQEPVARVIAEDEQETVDVGFVDWIGKRALKAGTLLYEGTAPAQKEPGLTDAEIEAIRRANIGRNSGELYAFEFARAVLLAAAQKEASTGPATAADSNT